MFHKFNQNRTLIRKYEREEKEYMTKFTVERPKIMKKLYKINAANTDLAVVAAQTTEPPCARDDKYDAKLKASPKKMEKAVKSKLRGMIKLQPGATVFLADNWNKK